MDKDFRTVTVKPSAMTGGFLFELINYDKIQNNKRI